MATLQQIEATYDYMDEIWRESLKTAPDITCAMYNGNFSLTLEEAQKAKHNYILKGINFKIEDKILDIGCGWGPMLQAIKENGGYATGLTLSPAQARICKEGGHTVLLKDWKNLTVNETEIFDGIVSIGAFEHFCSIEDVNNNRQEEIYIQFFRTCYDLLKPGGSLYLQTMMWGKKVPSTEIAGKRFPKLSDEWVIENIINFYPGSWLPNNLEQIVKCASQYFTLQSENNGRLDYVQTLNEWSKKINKVTFKKLFLLMKLIPKYITNAVFRKQITSIKYSCQTLCFKRRIMDHQRLIFKRK